MKTTNWSSPHTNIWKAILSLQRALAAGQTARLVRMRNEDCEHPILTQNHDKDFRNYKFSSGTLQTRKSIADDRYKSDFQKYLTLNYKTCYGTEEAVKRYYETGKLSKDNIVGHGVSHLVEIRDLIRYLAAIGDDRAEMFRAQYLDTDTEDEMHFFDNYVSELSEYAPKKFRRKLWTVVLYHGMDARSMPKMRPWMRLLGWIQAPLKYIPQKSVLRMDNYRVVTFRVGDVTNGISIDIHIPKRFGFN